MNAILISVDFADILSITLPYNRHHFDQVMVVTTRDDIDTQYVAQKNQCHIWMTDAFYEGGATFNKWLALEQGLDMLGRKGWICVMDADVLWPKEIEKHETDHGHLSLCEGRSMLKIGDLCTPFRRMWEDWPASPPFNMFWNQVYGSGLPPLPVESNWTSFPLHRQQQEFAGYSQIFHANDPHLGPAPWHEIDWKHAGGADSFFQMKWPEACKIRPPFEVLHLGPAGQNWFGRSTPRADGTLLEGSTERREMSGRKIWEQRRANIDAGRDRFHGEKLG